MFGHKLRPEMRESFTEWLTQTPFVQDAEEATSAVEVCDAVLGLIGESRPQFDPIAWVPDDVHELWNLQDALLNDPDVDDEDFVGAEVAADAMSMAAFVLLMYLGDTGQWAGTESDLQHCLTDLEPADHRDEPRPLTPSMVTPAVVDPAAELAALETLPLIRRLGLFVDWFGTGKSVTGAGVLRPAHALALAEILDIDLAPRKLRTMLDVTELRHLWTVVQEIGLVTVSSTKAYPGPAMVRWLSSNPDLLRDAVAASVAVKFAEDNRRPYWQFQSDILTMQYLLAGMTDTPLGAFAGTPTGAPAGMGIVGECIEDSLESLADDGLIVISDVVTVPKPLHSAVLAGMPDLEFDDDELFDERIDDLPPMG